jgi:hypothetical protein
MEGLGELRHRREGRRRIERAVSESNPEALLHVSAGDPSTPLRFAQCDGKLSRSSAHL